MATRSKTSSKAKTKTTTKPRDTLRAVRDDLSALTKRLQAADRATNESVAALETALGTLAVQTGHGGAQDGREAQLNTQVEALKSHLTGMIRETQRAVNTDLKAVLDDPRLGTISQAIDTANARVERAEAEQLRNLTTLKSYIASLAREVDASLETERTTRQTEIAACVEKIDTQGQTLKDTQARLDSIETDTATALELIGDKVTQFAEKATTAREDSARELKIKITDIALETQKNFEQYKDGVDRNIEALQTAHESAKQDLNRDLDTLRTRLETLEYGLSPQTAHNPVSGAIASIEDAFSPTPATQTLAPAEPEPLAEPQAGPSLADPSKSAVVMPFVTDTAAATANPYATPNTSLNNIAQQNGEATYTTPQDNSLAPYETQPYQQGLGQQASHALQPQTELASEFSADPYEQLTDQADPYKLDDTKLGNSDVNTDPMPYAQTYDDMPYENPAYAENGGAIDTQRPGGPIEMSGGAKRSSLFTPSNLRAAMLGVAVLGAGYVVVNTLKGGKSDPTTPPSNVFVENDPSKLTSKAKAGGKKAAAGASKKTIDSLEPIGQYTKNIDKAASKAPAAKTALNAAVKSGNPDAQYQLGLTRLQNGETKQALNLLRASANKGQPAAQYRLGKLYETGNGVAKDLETARGLIEKSATNGNRIAMHDLANFYANGSGGVEQDLSIAAKWFEKAAERGVVDSQYNIGYLYEFGFGVTKNPVTAHVWYGIAASQGDTEAEKRIAVLNSTLSDVEIESAKERIAGFKPAKIDKVANGIFENPSWKKQTKKSDKRPQVVKVQALLNDLGYTAGTADGQIGAKTRSAIIAFEKANGMPETGRVNSALVKQLQLAAGA